MKSYFKKYLVFICGLYFLSAGIVLIVRSTLGTTPISSANYVLSLNSPLTLGTWTFITNMLLIAGQLWLIRGRRTRRDLLEISLQIPFSFLFSLFIDANMTIFSSVNPSGWIAGLTVLALGCLTQSLGVVLELKPKVSMMSAEAFVNYASRRYGKDFGKMKVAFDVTLVLIAVAISLICSGTIEGIGVGTVIAACVTGYIVRFINFKVLTRNNLTAIASLLGLVRHAK